MKENVGNILQQSQVWSLSIGTLFSREDTLITVFSWRKIPPLSEPVFSPEGALHTSCPSCRSALGPVCRAGCCRWRPESGRRSPRTHLQQETAADVQLNMDTILNCRADNSPCGFNRKQTQVKQSHRNCICYSKTLTGYSAWLSVIKSGGKVAQLVFKAQ